MAYTKKVSRHDKITIDGTDVSNSFRTFGYTSEHTNEPAGGFSTTGVDENLPGATTQGFSGEAFYTEELAAIVEPLHRNRTVCVITWQPDGLVDATREVYSGSMYVMTFGPADTFGSVAVMPFAATTALAAGITVGNWT